MTDREPHLDDGALVRVLDGCVEPRDRPGHLAVCDRCLARLEELEALDRMVGVGLSHSLPGRFRPRSGVAVAAALVVVSLAALVPDVRARVAELVGLWSEPSPPPVSTTAPPTPAPTATPAPGRLEASFLPRGDTLTVAFAAFQAAGEIVLLPVPGSTATARADGAAGNPGELLIMPDGVLFRNRPGSDASYEVRVPVSVEWIVVHVGGTDVTALRRSVLRSSLGVPLSEGGAAGRE